MRWRSCKRTTWSQKKPMRWWDMSSWDSPFVRWERGDADDKKRQFQVAMLEKQYWKLLNIPAQEGTEDANCYVVKWVANCDATATLLFFQNNRASRRNPDPTAPDTWHWSSSAVDNRKTDRIERRHSTVRLTESPQIGGSRQGMWSSLRTVVPFDEEVFGTQKTYQGMFWDGFWTLTSSSRSCTTSTMRLACSRSCPVMRCSRRWLRRRWERQSLQISAMSRPSDSSFPISVKWFWFVYSSVSLLYLLLLLVSWIWRNWYKCTSETKKIKGPRFLWIFRFSCGKSDCYIRKEEAIEVSQKC